MTQNQPIDTVQIVNPTGGSAAVLICEHASHYIPDALNHLGLPLKARDSHAAWDPGALGVSVRIARKLDAVLIASKVSRLVYDCNRPPSAPDAMPARSEVIDIPGNFNLTPEAREQRAQMYYEPFRKTIADQLRNTIAPIIVTIHSFTPVYYGQNRRVEIGVLHDRDTRLADAMLNTSTEHTNAVVLRNEPYGPDNGVTHTLREHALPDGHLNVMLEIRNDLIQTEDQQNAMGDMIAYWLVDAVAATSAQGTVQCVV